MMGTITKMNAYKSGKGYFVGLDGTDYMFFGATQAQVGDKVDCQLGKPTKDGTPTIKKIAYQPIEAFLDKQEPPVFRAHDVPKLDAREEYWKAKEKRDIENEPIKVRLACLAAACSVAKATDNLSMDIVGLSKIFEKYARSGD